MKAALLLTANGLSSSTIQRSHEGQGRAWRREESRQARLATAEAELRELSPAVVRAQETWFALSALAERVRPEDLIDAVFAAVPTP